MTYRDKLFLSGFKSYKIGVYTNDLSHAHSFFICKVICNQRFFGFFLVILNADQKDRSVWERDCPRSTYEFLRTCWNVYVRSRSNWNLEVLVFQERGKLEYLVKNLSEQGRKSTKTNNTHIWRRRRGSNQGHIGGRRMLSPLRHSCSPKGRNNTKWRANTNS